MATDVQFVSSARRRAWLPAFAWAALAAVPVVVMPVVDGHRADCVFVVDDSIIVGGGYTGIAWPDIPGATQTAEQRAGWVAVAELSLVDGEVVVSSGGSFYRLPAPVTP